MERKYPYPDGEEAFQRVLERIRCITPEEWAARIERIEREHEEGEAEYRRLMGISDTADVLSADAPLSLTEAHRPRVFRRPKRAHRMAA